MNIRLLTAQEIDCRVNQVGGNTGQKWCSLLLYKDARVDYKILDETFGSFGWQCDYEVINNHLFCTISIFDKTTGQWIKKQNVGTESNTEKEKGEASDALKRAGVVVGIGRELYTAPFIRVALSDSEISKNKSGFDTTYTKFFVREVDYDKNRNINKLVIVDSRGNVRFNMGTGSTKPEEPQEAKTAPKITAALKKAIASCNKREELITIWNQNKDLHNNSKFVDLFTNQMNEIKKKTA